MRAFLAAAAGLLLAGCAGKDGQVSAPERAPAVSRLQQVAEGARHQPPCDRVVALEWSQTYPVPLDSADGSRFKILYYPLVGKPPREPSLYSPEAEAEIDLKTGKPVSCALMPGEPRLLSSHSLPPGVRGIGVLDMERRRAKLNGLLEAVASRYAARAGRPLEADRSLAGEYLAAFESLAPPDLLPYYYKVNPVFWDWLRAASGLPLPWAAARN